MGRPERGRGVSVGTALVSRGCRSGRPRMGGGSRPRRPQGQNRAATCRAALGGSRGAGLLAPHRPPAEVAVVSPGLFPPLVTWLSSRRRRGSARVPRWVRGSSLSVSEPNPRRLPGSTVSGAPASHTAQFLSCLGGPRRQRWRRGGDGVGRVEGGWLPKEGVQWCVHRRVQTQRQGSEQAALYPRR